VSRSALLRLRRVLRKSICREPVSAAEVSPDVTVSAAPEASVSGERPRLQFVMQNRTTPLPQHPPGGLEVVATVLESPSPHIGKIYELTGPRSQDMASMAAEYSAALGRPVTYVDVPFDDWRDRELRSRGLPDHVFDHFVTMARLHAENRYDRMTHDVEAITGRPGLTVRSYVESRADLFGKRA
jgi:hypothetical protein